MDLAGNLIKMDEQYPDGKLTQDDQGSLRVTMGVVDGRVLIRWGKPTDWIGFDKSGLRVFINALEDMYKKI